MNPRERKQSIREAEPTMGTTAAFPILSKPIDFNKCSRICVLTVLMALKMHIFLAIGDV